MYLDINKYLLILIGWLLRMSYQLECLQCTSSIKRVQSNWDHSCLDGTLKSQPCQKPVNETEPAYRQCVSALTRIGQKGLAGIIIDRHCSYHIHSPHDCDPQISEINFNLRDTFFCSSTCSSNGCNRHLVENITFNRLIIEYIPSNAIQLLKTNYSIVFIFVCYLIIRCELFS